MPISKQEAIPLLRDFILKEVLGQAVELRDDAPLVEGGRLASLQTIDLVEYIATRFGVELEPEDVDAHNFRSLDTIASLVARKAG